MVLGAMRIELLFIALDLPGCPSGGDAIRRLSGQQRAMRLILASAEEGKAGNLGLEDLGTLIRRPYCSSHVVALVARSLNWPELPQQSEWN